MKVAIIDGSNVAYGFMHATQYKVSMMLGLPSIVGSVYKKYKPDLIIIAWEGVCSFREDIVDDYKIDRCGMPDDIYTDCLLARQVLKALGIINATSHRFEADDVIATLVKKFHDNEDISSIYIISQDKDLYQCLHSAKVVIAADKSKLGRPNGLITKDKFIEHFGFDPKFFACYQTLIGDKTDNVSGVAGVGPKSASELLNGEFRADVINEDGTFDWSIFDIPSSSFVKTVAKKMREFGMDNTKRQWSLVKLNDDIDVDLDHEIYNNTLLSILDTYELHDKIRDYKLLFDNYLRDFERNRDMALRIIR